MRFAAALALAILGGCAAAHHPPPTSAYAYEATPYDASRDARADLDRAIANARAQGRHVLAVFGANWCHDSRGLAGLLQTPRFRALTEARYEVVFIDSGTPQIGKGRNLHLASGLGVTGIEGTPTVIVLAPDGAVLNADTAKSWRNAASRSEDAVYLELERLTRS